jgi:hypothetical protein
MSQAIAENLQEMAPVALFAAVPQAAITNATAVVKAGTGMTTTRQIQA